MTSVAIFTVALMAGQFVSSDAEGFLHQIPASYQQITVGDVAQTLQSELNSLTGSSRIEGIQDELRSMYSALPKNERGRLEPATVRYALHRYFMQKHGWRLNGLALAGSTWEPSSPTIMMAERAPAYIQSIFETRLQGQGLDLHDLAAFAATLVDLIHREVMGDLEVVYTALGMPTDMPVEDHKSVEARWLYLAKYLNGTTLHSREELQANEDDWRTAYPAWVETQQWTLDLIATQKEVQPRNPFVETEPSFEESVVFLEEMGHHFGAFQNLECHRLKEELLDMEIGGTGRVPLSKFYAGYWTDEGTTFTESVEYLDHVGALDQTDPNKARVVIANYLTSLSVCMGGSSFYHVCCMNECEDLLGKLEIEFRAPSVSPARVAEVVSGLSSDTVQAPRNLSSTLLTRLDEIAQLHDGSVPLHGRLFEQWMHHAFPRECPFPQVAGAKNPLSITEWEAATGRSAEASESNMLTAKRKGNTEVDISLPWDNVEDLVAVHKLAPKKERSPWTFPRSIAALALLVSFLVPLARASKEVASGVTVTDHSKSHLV